MTLTLPGIEREAMPGRVNVLKAFRWMQHVKEKSLEKSLDVSCCACWSCCRVVVLHSKGDFCPAIDSFDAVARQAAARLAGAPGLIDAVGMQVGPQVRAVGRSGDSALCCGPDLWLTAADVFPEARSVHGAVAGAHQLPGFCDGARGAGRAV